MKKEYQGKTILDIENINISKGKIVGVFGPNGSGKSSLIKTIASLMSISSGEILIDGMEPGIKTKSIVSYLPETPYLPRWMTIKQLIGFYNDFYEDFDKEKARAIIQLIKLDVKARISTLSKGLFNRLAVSIALCRNSKLILLDEPFAGVDRIVLSQIIELIMDNFNQEHSLIISTQVISETERIYDDIIFLKDGEVVINENSEDLRMRTSKSIDGVFREVFG